MLTALRPKPLEENSPEFAPAPIIVLINKSLISPKILLFFS